MSARTGSDKIRKVREDRLRRVASRQGLTLRKSPRRDVRALDYGRFHLADSNGVVIFGGGKDSGFSASLDDIEEYLNRRRINLLLLPISYASAMVSALSRAARRP